MPKEEKNKKGEGIEENEDDSLEAKENSAKEEEGFKVRSMVSLTGPEAVAMFMIAFTLDAIGWLLLLFLLDDFFILDIIGFILIGGWLFFRTGNIPTTLKNRKGIGKKLSKRLGLSTIIEMIPWIGDLVPSWTIAVYYELKNNPV
jgi:hypothetical protein